MSGRRWVLLYKIMVNTTVARKLVPGTISAPYFEADNLLIYKDDILKISAIPNGSVDLIVTSPPYNVDIHYNSNGDDLNYEDYLEFTQKWIKKCFDLSKNEGVV